MKSLIVMGTLLTCLAANAAEAVTMAVSAQSGAAASELATQLAGRLEKELAAPVKVVTLADTSQVVDWLNRYATADLALLEDGYVGARPGQFVVIGQAGRGLTLVGRQGIGGDLPQRMAGILGGGGERPAPVASVKPAGPATAVEARAGTRQAPPSVAQAASLGASKSINEDRYFVTQTFREKFGKDPDAEQLEHWSLVLRSGTLSKQQFYEQICQQGRTLCTTKE